MNNKLILDKLEGVKQRFEEVAKLISEPGIVADMKQYVRLNKEYKELEPVINVYNEYRNILSNIEHAKEILTEDKDEELKEITRNDGEPIKYSCKYLGIVRDVDLSPFDFSKPKLDRLANITKFGLI